MVGYLRRSLWLVRSTPILLGISIFIIYHEFRAPIVFLDHFHQHFDANKLYNFVFFDLYTFFYFFIIPALITRILFNQKLAQIGLRWPSNKLKASGYFILGLVTLIPFIYLFSKYPSFQRYYSFKNVSFEQFLIMQLVLGPCYYFSEEFFFRGFLFIHLWNKVKWHSFWITDIIFALAHLGKPWPEILLSAIASVVFNILTLTTRSIYPALLLHLIMGVLMNVFVNYIDV